MRISPLPADGGSIGLDVVLLDVFQKRCQYIFY